MGGAVGVALGTAWIAGSLAFRAQLDAFANRRRVLPVVSWLNSRAVSVYLWYFPAYGIGAAVAHRLLGAAWDAAHAIVSFVVAIPATFLLATAFGWLEDVAARRPPVLIPTLTSRPAAGFPTPAPAPPPTAPSRSPSRAHGRHLFSATSTTARPVHPASRLRSVA
jgi:hypothetical protein